MGFQIIRGKRSVRTMHSGLPRRWALPWTIHAVDDMCFMQSSQQVTPENRALSYRIIAGPHQICYCTWFPQNTMDIIKMGTISPFHMRMSFNTNALRDFKCLNFKFVLLHIYKGARCWWRSWLRHCATSRKVAGSIPDGVTEIFHWYNPSSRTMVLGLTQPLTEMSTRNISWG
jgi:hypothetical protein